MVSPRGKKDKQKEIAHESFKTQKARHKLQKRLEVMDNHITKEAVEKKTTEIHRWISRHADRRISLKNKSISLFDENQNAAEISAKVAKVAEQIHKEHLPE